MTIQDDPADWPAVWARMSQDHRDAVTRIIGKYADFLAPSYRTTTTPTPSWETFLEVGRWQEFEADILDQHAAWLSRTKAMFERRGWPWTTGELMARAHVREVGE